MAEAQENPNVEEQEEEECPKCPPPGAPAWMATFADMATLLMAFFVLILSFAEFNVPKFKQISGSMKNAFGIQSRQQGLSPFNDYLSIAVIDINFALAIVPNRRFDKQNHHCQ